jgi:alpha-tubulin suppressor-like RCC1 family protein
LSTVRRLTVRGPGRCGRGSHGALGHGGREDERGGPRRVDAAALRGRRLTQVAAGGAYRRGHTLALAADGAVFGWGSAPQAGEAAGEGGATEQAEERDAEGRCGPAVLSLGPAAAGGVTQLFAGWSHSALLCRPPGPGAMSSRGAPKVLD